MELRLVATLFTGLLCGILFRSFVDLGSSFVVLLLLIALAISILVKDKSLHLVAIFFLAAGLGVLRYGMVDTQNGLTYLQKYNGQVVGAEGMIIDEPSEKDKTTSFTAVVTVDRTLPINVLILAKPYVKYKYGDKISIYGRIERVKNFTDSFDYVAYMGKDEIYYQFFDPKIKVVSTGNGSYIQEKLFDFKNSFLENINSVISEPESSLMGGLILGAKSSLDKDLTSEFKRAGLIHIVALSGYNVTVVADGLMKLIWFLPITAKLCIGSIGIIMFAIMTGAGSTVVRASLMVLLAMLARATGRVYMVASALFVAATLMILYDPKILVFDISFQLSFLATAGLIFFTPILEKYLKFIPEKWGLRAGLISTLSAQLAVWPIILYRMGNFSLVSIPANLMVGPAVPGAMFLGFLTGFAGYISYYVSLLLSQAAYLPLLYIVKITEFYSSLPFASLNIAYFPLWLTIGVYIVYLGIVLSADV